MLPLAAGLIAVAFVTIALAVDIALLHADFRAVSSVADAAAEGGAAMIDIDAAHDGVIAIDAPTAASVAASIAHDLGGPAASVGVDVEDTTVCVTVERDHATHALVFVGARSITVTVSSCAEPGVG